MKEKFFWKVPFICASCNWWAGAIYAEWTL